MKHKLFWQFILLSALLLSAAKVSGAQTAETPADTAVEAAAQSQEESSYLASPSTNVERLDELNRTSGSEPITEGEQNVFRMILWYLPNRLIDLFDVFRFDVGIGGAFGGVVRATRYGQVGGRYVAPLSARIGVRGRTVPFFLEKHSESGFGPNFLQTPNRYVTPFEIGVGADAIVGAYVGLSFDELFDFFAGILLFDPKSDDLVH